ncbi:hypothetical protein D3C81_1207720 [compost metagenome]
MLGAQQFFTQLRQCLGGDRALAQLHRRADFADRFVRAGRAQRFLPAQRLVLVGERLELGADFSQRIFPALLAQLAAGEEAPRAGDAAGLQAFAFQRLHALTDDEFRGAAADVDHQPALAGLGWLRVGNAEIDQARFFATADHFDGMAQRGFGRHQE